MEIKKFGFYFLLGIILFLAFKFYTIIYNFLPSIATGCVLAYLFNPLYEYFHHSTKNGTLSAFIVIIISFVLILIPATLLILAVQKQIGILFNEQTISQMKNVIVNIDSFIYNKFAIHISDDLITTVFSKFISGIQETITSLTPKMIVSFTRLIISFFVTIFLLYYLLKNSKSVIATFRDYFPLSYKNVDILIEQVGQNTRTLIYGQLLVALIQGSLGAIGFFICNIAGVIFWGLVMAVMSFIPLLGASIIWLPASIILIANEEYFKGTGLILWGSFIVGTVDNLIRPKLTSSLGKIHPVTVLLGVFIGIKEWGIIGIVIGPLIISVLFILIKMFREEYLTD